MKMAIKWFSALAAAVLLALSPVHAQGLLGAATQAKDLTFPKEPSAIAAVNGSRMVLLKPDGPGPFPAIVLQHQCAGLHTLEGAPNRSMGTWAQVAVRQGYVVLLLDSLGQRGVNSVCDEPKNAVNYPRGVRDALQAADYLRTFAFVDRKRIAHIGFSWGAMVALYGSSSNQNSVLPGSDGFAATVALYPGCFTIRPKSGPPYEIIQNGIDHPVLVLMGDKDIETPPDECIPKLQAQKDAGAPVEWRVLANATHCWDCEHLNGSSRTRRGVNIVYRYNPGATDEAKRRIFEFLDKTWSAARTASHG